MDTNTVLWGIGFPLLLFFLALAIGTIFAMTSSESVGFLVAKISTVLAAIDLIAMAVFWALATRQTLPWNVVVPGLAAIVAIPGLVVGLQWIADREIWLSSRLFPGYEAAPPIPGARIEIPKDVLKVFYGGNVAIATTTPYTVLQLAGEKMIEIGRDKSGNELVILTLRIFDDRNNIIARVDEEGFWVENSTRSKRPDPNTLVVYDHLDQEVLRIVFVNSTTLSISGIFRHPRMSAPVIVTEKFIQVGTNVFSGNVAMGGAVAINVGN